MNKLRTVLQIGWLVAVVLALGWAVMHKELFEPDRLAAMLADFGALAPWVFMILRVVGAVLLVPGSIMAIGAGILFGPFGGAVYNLVASTCGAVLAFSVARFLAPRWVASYLVGGSYLGRLARGVEIEGWRFVAFVRLVPLFPYNILNYGLGLTRIKLSHYTLASLVCMLPGDIAYVYLGYAGREAAAGSGTALQTALIAVALLAALAFIPRFVRVFRASGRSVDSTDEPG